jgi:hypothetical protein
LSSLFKSGLDGLPRSLRGSELSGETASRVRKPPPPAPPPLPQLEAFHYAAQQRRYMDGCGVHHQHHQHRGDRRGLSLRWQNAAAMALSSCALAALNMRDDMGGWNGGKGTRVANGALGAATADLFAKGESGRRGAATRRTSAPASSSCIQTVPTPHSAWPSSSSMNAASVRAGRRLGAAGHSTWTVLLTQVSCSGLTSTSG